MRATRPMKLLVPVFLALAVLAMGACCGDDGGAAYSGPLDPAKARVKALEDDTGAVLDTLTTYFSALDAGDEATLAGLFTSRAQVYLNDGQALSAAEFLARHRERWATRGAPTTTYRLGGATLSRPYGWAKITGTTAYQEDGAERSIAFSATVGVEQQGDRWLISHLHLSQQGA